jgi:hypothetical protein
MRRFVLALAPIVVAAAIAASGEATTSSVTASLARATSARPLADKADLSLVRRTLAKQVADVRNGGGWRTLKPAGKGTGKGSTACASAGTDLTAYATSPGVSYDNELDLWVSDFLYSDAAAARHELRKFGNKRFADCLEKMDVAGIKRYAVGKAELSGPKSVRTGAEGRALEIVAPYKYRGRTFHEYYDTTYARSGRVIVALGIVSSTTNLSYEVKLAAWIMQLSSTVRAARPEGWTAVGSDVQRCERQASHKADLGAPIIYTRGAYTAVLFVDQRDNYTFFCSWAPKYSGSGNGTAIPDIDSPGGLYAPPPAVGIQDSQGGNQICDSPPTPNLGEMYGFAGSDVVGATFEFAHERSIKAIVARGFYIASWPYASWPDAVALKTTSGATVTRRVPNNTGGCGNTTKRTHPHKKVSPVAGETTTTSKAKAGSHHTVLLTLVIHLPPGSFGCSNSEMASIRRLDHRRGISAATTTCGSATATQVGVIDRARCTGPHTKLALHGTMCVESASIVQTKR